MVLGDCFQERLRRDEIVFDVDETSLVEGYVGFAEAVEVFELGLAWCLGWRVDRCRESSERCVEGIGLRKTGF